MLKSRNVAIFVAIISLCLIAQVSANGSSGPNPISGASTAILRIVATPSPNQPPPANNYLKSISASSATDIWSVGAGVIHFDGAQWTGFSLPDINGDGSDLLTGVADLSPNNVWAVGYINFQVIGAYEAPIVEHFDGTSWTIFTSPQFPAPDEAFLGAITAISPTDIWAGGEVFADPNALPLLEHFDGASWTQFDPPVSDCLVYGMSSDASNDVWAVGITLGGGTCTLHYDGSAWQGVPSQNPGLGYNYLAGVVALGPNNVWASGWYVQQPNQDRPLLTLIEHWDGSSWQVVSSPNIGPAGQVSSQLRGITAVSANDVWAFGDSVLISNQMAYTLVLHWDGTSWIIVPSPDVGLNNFVSDDLNGGTVIPPGNIWIVGGNGVFDTLVLNAMRQ